MMIFSSVLIEEIESVKIYSDSNRFVPHLNFEMSSSFSKRLERVSKELACDTKLRGRSTFFYITCFLFRIFEINRLSS